MCTSGSVLILFSLLNAELLSLLYFPLVLTLFLLNAGFFLTLFSLYFQTFSPLNARCLPTPLFFLLFSVFFSPERWIISLISFVLIYFSLTLDSVSLLYSSLFSVFFSRVEILRKNERPEYT